MCGASGSYWNIKLTDSVFSSKDAVAVAAATVSAGFRIRIAWWLWDRRFSQAPKQPVEQLSLFLFGLNIPPVFYPWGSLIFDRNEPDDGEETIIFKAITIRSNEKTNGNINKKRNKENESKDERKMNNVIEKYE